MKYIVDSFVKVICFLLAFYHFYTAGFGFFHGVQQQSIFALLSLLVVFSMSISSKKKKGKIGFIINIVLICVTVIAFLNPYINYMEIMVRPSTYSSLDIILGIFAILLVFEAARRSIGPVLPLLAIGVILYSNLTGSSMESLIGFIYHSEMGMWGLLTYLGSTLLGIFLLFGTALTACGGGQTFIDLASYFSGKARGGPAKVAVIASALFGMISGSTVSNVATTGSFTIPLMKKIGYSPEEAGGIEAVASMGGVLTPPLMGSTAFVMAELLGISYLSIMGYAIIPAILYFTAVFCFVHFTAIKKDMGCIVTKEVKISEIIKWGKLAPLFLPIIIFLLLLAKGFAVSYCVFLATATCLLLFIFQDLNFSKIKERLRIVYFIFIDGGKTISRIAPLLICAQVFVFMIGESGIGIRFASYIMQVGSFSIVISLIMAAILTLFLGMGMPPVAGYLFITTIVSPPLHRLGISLIPMHMFFINFAAFGTLTPPVCAGVFMASGIANSNWFKTGITAVGIVLPAMIIPFTYVYMEPYLLGIGPLGIVVTRFIIAFFGVAFISISVSGAFSKGSINFITRFIFFICGLMIIIPFPLDLGWIRYLGIGASIGLLIMFKLFPNKLYKLEEAEGAKKIT